MQVEKKGKMNVGILNTWTIMLLANGYLLTFCLSIPSNPSIQDMDQTMYDAIALKCPNLKLVNFTTNEIFKQCTDWSKINSTDKLDSETKEDLKCLLYYETFSLFCISLGDDIVKFEQLLSPNLKDFTLDVVCSVNHSIFPSNKSLEHNLSSLIKQKDDCVLLCIEWSGNHVSNICKLAYYFTNFNVSKLSDTDGKSDTHSLVKNEIDANPQIPQTVDNAKKKGNSDVASVRAAKMNDEKPLLLISELTEQDGKAVAPNAPNSNAVLEGSFSTTRKNVAQSKVSDQITQKSIPQQPETKTKTVQELQATNDENSRPDAEKNLQHVENVPKPKKNEELPNVEGHLQSPVEVKDHGSQIAVDDPGQDEWEEDEEGGEPENQKVEPAMPVENNEAPVIAQTKKVKPNTVEDEAVNAFNTPDEELDGDSYFFSYFTVMMCLVIVGYVGYHNRQKVLALILEGKKGRRPNRGKRPNSANYHKLDSNLEEAISSSCTKDASNVIY